MRKLEKKPCGIISRVYCNEPNWSCRKCLDTKEWLLKSLRSDLAQMKDNLKKLPGLIELKEKSIIGIEKEIETVKKHVEGD